MLKAHGVTDDGKPLLVFGLSRLNVDHLLKKEPIFFTGDVIAMPGHGFVIAWAEEGSIAQRIHAYFMKQYPSLTIHVFGLTSRTLDRLKTNVIDVPGDSIQLEGYLIRLAYAENETELAKAFGHDMQPLEPGFQARLDPVTGQLVRSKPKAN